MEAKNHFAKFSRWFFYFIMALALCCPVFCEKSEVDANEAVTKKQYKSYLHEFQSTFGKQMEEKFGLKWIEGGFLHNFSEEIQFYAYRRATLDKARALELALLDSLAEAIKADPKMLSYLNSSSLTPESIGVDISFVSLQNWSYDDGSIDNIYIRNSKSDNKRYLKYRTTDPFSDYSAEKDETFPTFFKNLLKMLSSLIPVNHLCP